MPHGSQHREARDVLSTLATASALPHAQPPGCLHWAYLAALRLAGASGVAEQQAGRLSRAMGRQGQEGTKAHTSSRWRS